jgi:hypothetical protein
MTSWLAAQMILTGRSARPSVSKPVRQRSNKNHFEKRAVNKFVVDVLQNSRRLER